MTLLPIRLFGDPVLRTRAREVEAVDDSVLDLVTNMEETMRAAPGVGLAAPQVGVLRRVIVWENEEDRGALVNPVIVAAKGRIEGEEGCLSLPGLIYPVARAEWVRVEGVEPSGRPVAVEAFDLTARILQHEVDHLNGVLFIDRLPPDLRREALAKLREQELEVAVKAESAPTI
ncbi:MAG: peptide deformylase [Actinomycetota bacterium]|nr:peptide deformylase [Actinomycetota bacterium]